MKAFSKGSEEKTWLEAKRSLPWAQTLVSEWRRFSLGLAVQGLGEPWVLKKPSGEEVAQLTIFYWGRGGGYAGPLGDTFFMEPDGKGGSEAFFLLICG